MQLRNMKVIAILTLISLCSISLFWYVEVATPSQKEFTQGKAKEYSAVLAEKSKEAGGALLDKSKEIYEDRDKYIDQAKGLSQSISHKVETVIEAVKKKDSSISESDQNLVTITTTNYQSGHFFRGQATNTHMLPKRH